MNAPTKIQIEKNFKFIKAVPTFKFAFLVLELAFCDAG